MSRFPYSHSVKKMALAGVLMALNIAASSFGVPVPGGHIYLCDVVICTAALLLDPFYAFAVGGIGSFIGDIIFYPLPMFVTLVTHGLQAVVISLCRRYLLRERRYAGAVIGLVLGTVIMVVGYTLGAAFVYSTPEYAIIKIPYELLQASVGAVTAFVLCEKFRLSERLARL